MKQPEGQTYDVVIVGGGAAGMMAAGTAAQNGYRTLLIEKNSRLGRKLLITGKGRCNLTNHCDVANVIASVPSNGRFLYSAVSKFPPQDVMAFFEDLGVPVKTERGNRVFPQSDCSRDVVDALAGFVKGQGAHVLVGTVSRLLLQDRRAVGVQLEDGREISSGNVIVCCGGLSYPGTGSTGDGYRLAQQAGHTVTPLRPSLVPLTAYGRECAGMQGLSLKNVAIQVYDTKKQHMIYEDFGEMLFTHFGLTGPIILSASSHMRGMEPGRYEIHLDVKPALSPEQLDIRLQRDLEKNRNKDWINSLSELLPRKMIPVMVEKSGIAPDTKCNQITRQARQQFGGLLKNFPIVIKGFRPVQEAIVTSGGVCVKEVNPKTMESKCVSGLYFAGEVLDVDAYTGGFNLQIAFSTGRLAAHSLYQEKERRYDSSCH